MKKYNINNQVNPLPEARAIFKAEFQKNRSIRLQYQTSIAMLLHDKCGVTDLGTRNAVASDILTIIFG